jgi:hypothetical protein
METLHKKSKPVGELPLSWQEEGPFTADEEVTVWVSLADPESAVAVTLDELMDTIGNLVRRRGLVDEKLETILYD